MNATAPTLPHWRAGIRKQQRTAFLFTVPLLLFLLLTFLLPIGVLLVRAVENPEVAAALPITSNALRDWDGTSALPNTAYDAIAKDLRSLSDSAQAGNVARRLNSEINGARSLIMSTYRALHASDEDLHDARAKLLDIDSRWSELPYWHAIAKNASRWTPDYLLTAIDLKRDATGSIVEVDADHAAFRPILYRTFWISFLVTLICLLLAYPLAYWLSTLSPRHANVLMILILVPFWTSILVRVAAWIVLLQREGLVNTSLLSLGLINEPLSLLFNRVGVVVAMVHILLPFMILPLYSVMKSVPREYMRAAISLGSSPLSAFFRVYVPQTYSGISAGVVLVFILALGYYVTPALVGGANDQMLSYSVARYANVELNWGMACALGAILLMATILLYAAFRRLFKAELSLT